MEYSFRTKLEDTVSEIFLAGQHIVTHITDLGAILAQIDQAECEQNVNRINLLRKMAQKYHPDKGGTNEAGGAFNSLKSLFETRKDLSTSFLRETFEHLSNIQKLCQKDTARKAEFIIGDYFKDVSARAYAKKREHKLQKRKGFKECKCGSSANQSITLPSELTFSEAVHSKTTTTTECLLSVSSPKKQKVETPTKVKETLLCNKGMDTSVDNLFFCELEHNLGHNHDGPCQSMSRANQAVSSDTSTTSTLKKSRKRLDVLLTRLEYLCKRSCGDTTIKSYVTHVSNILTLPTNSTSYAAKYAPYGALKKSWNDGNTSFVKCLQAFNIQKIVQNVDDHGQVKAPLNKLKADCDLLKILETSI